MKNIYPKTNQSQHDSAHNTPSPHLGPQTTHTATPSNYQTIKTIFQALGFGISSFILLTMFAIFISNPVEAATEIPQVSINLDEVDSGQLLLRSENVISSAILLTTDVKVTVSGTVSRTTVSQRFINTGATWAEGVYAFPVGENAAVDSFKMRIGDRFIEGQIKEKKAAKIAYETAKSEVKKLPSSSKENQTFSPIRSLILVRAKLSPSRLSSKIKYHHETASGKCVFL
jgi:hypothetical protein